MHNRKEESISYIRFCDSSKSDSLFALRDPELHQKQLSSDSRHKKMRHALPSSLLKSHKSCLQKFVNLCMIDGKKTIASKLLKSTLFALRAATHQLSDKGDGILYFLEAIENVKPILEVKKVRIAGTTQLVPSVISQNRQETLAIRWILEAAMIQKRRKIANKVVGRKRLKKTLGLDFFLASEIIDAYNKTGVVRKKRDELHKLAEANRGFSHYRWW